MITSNLVALYDLLTSESRVVRVNHCVACVQMADSWHADESSPLSSWSGWLRSAHELWKLINMGSAGCDRLKDGVSQPRSFPPRFHQTLIGFSLLLHSHEVANCWLDLRKCNKLSAWCDLESLSTTDMFSSWFCSIIILTGYYSLFILDSWR